MKKILFASLVLASLPVFSADDAKPIATVNGREIPAIYGDLAKQNLLQQGAPNDANLNTRVKEALINQELLSRAAIEKRSGQNPQAGCRHGNAAPRTADQSLSGRLC